MMVHIPALVKAMTALGLPIIQNSPRALVKMPDANSGIFITLPYTTAAHFAREAAAIVTQAPQSP